MSNGGTGQGSAAPQPHKPPRWGLRYLKDVGVVYQKIWADQVAAWDAVLTKAESGNYTAGEWVGDVARMWDQWARDVWLLGFPLRRWAQEGDQIPVVAFVVDAAAQGADPKEVPLPVGVGEKIQATPQGFSTPSTGPLTKEHIACKISDDGTHLVVALRDLKSPRLGEGTHRCLLCGYDPESKKHVALAALEVVKM